jgi:hypothetical protein
MRHVFFNPAGSSGANRAVVDAGEVRISSKTENLVGELRSHR